MFTEPSLSAEQPHPALERTHFGSNHLELCLVTQLFTRLPIVISFFFFSIVNFLFFQCASLVLLSYFKVFT